MHWKSHSIVFCRSPISESLESTRLTNLQEWPLGPRLQRVHRPAEDLRAAARGHVEDDAARLQGDPSINLATLI